MTNRTIPAADYSRTRSAIADYHAAGAALDAWDPAQSDEDGHELLAAEKKARAAIGHEFANATRAFNDYDTAARSVHCPAGLAFVLRITSEET